MYGLDPPSTLFMAVSFYSALRFLPFTQIPRSSSVSYPSIPTNPKTHIQVKRRPSHFFVAENDSVTTDTSNASSEQKNMTPRSPNAQSTPKRAPLTMREKLRAARVLSRYSDSKPTKPEMGTRVLDALRETDKGKKGLPEAPTNLFDDSNRGLPKPGLTFNFPGGFDLFIIAFSFVLISTIMFTTTYIVWKAGAIHFNEY